MLAVMLISAILFLVMQTVSLRFIKVNGLRQNILVNGLFTAIVAVGLLIYSLISPMGISPETIIFGVIFGAVFIFCVSVYYFAMQAGPLSYTTFFFSASMLIPAVAGIFFFKEAPQLTTILGVLLFLAAFYFISVPASSGKGQKLNLKWFVLAILTWAANGTLAVLSKTQQTILKGEEVFSMMLICFISAAVFALLLYIGMLIFGKEKNSISGDFKKAFKATPFLIGAAAGTAGGNIILTYLSSRIQGAYLFPLVEGGVMVAVTLFSLVFLKEKINKWGFIGLIIGVAAIVVINL